MTCEARIHTTSPFGSHLKGHFHREALLDFPMADPPPHPTPPSPVIPAPTTAGMLVRLMSGVEWRTQAASPRERGDHLLSSPGRPQ